jgi:hypothetical protein
MLFFASLYLVFNYFARGSMCEQKCIFTVILQRDELHLRAIEQSLLPCITHLVIFNLPRLRLVCGSWFFFNTLPSPVPPTAHCMLTASMTPSPCPTVGPGHRPEPPLTPAWLAPLH